jgi:hypothetical protein
MLIAAIATREKGLAIVVASRIKLYDDGALKPGICSRVGPHLGQFHKVPD